jgi:hypothetical protein
MTWWKTFRTFTLAGFFWVFVTGCGGGTGSTNPSPPPAANFTLSLSPSSVALSPGGAGQAVQVSVAGQNGFVGSVSVTIGTLPSGVTASPSSLSVTAGAPETFTLSSSSATQLVQESVSVNGVSGTLTANASLQLTISGTAIADPFHTVGGSLVHGFYDESRQLLFATNPGLNELDVISGTDFTVQARVPVPQPWGIDQMADGNTLVIGTQAQEIITVDENTLSVTQHPYSAVGDYFFSLFFPNVVAMANGNVLIIGAEQGIESNDLLDGGQYLYEWNSNTNTFSQLEPTPENSSGGWETDSLARSADHEWAVFAADQFYLYSSDADSLTTVPLNTVNPPDNTYGVRGYALNADGSEIAVASAMEVSFFNRSFALLGSAPLQTAFQTARSAVQFTPDGTRLFLQYALPLWLEEVGATNYNALGILSGSVDPDDDNLERLLTIDAEGHGYVGIDEGLRVVNVTQAPVPNSANNNNPGPPQCPPINGILPLGTSQQFSFLDPINGLSIYIGGIPTPLLQGNTVINIPASSVAGPVDVECVDVYGDMSVATADVSYGIQPLALSANLLPPTGNPLAYLFGSGFYDSTELFYTTNPPFQGSVSMGGQPTTSATTLGSIWSGTVFEGLGFNIPNGSPGESASVGVSSSFGSGTLASAATYYPTPTVIPATGLLQLIYDTHRNLLYALTSTQVDVLNPGTLQWQSPMQFPAAATGTYDTMALTPDGSKLVVVGLAPQTGSGAQPPQFIVLDPDGVSPPSVLTYSGSFNSQLFGSIAITEFNTVIMPGSPSITLNLATNTFASLSLSFPYSAVIRASADGSHLYSALLNASNGEVYSIDPSTYAATSEGFGTMFWTDLAVAPDGSQFAAIDAPPDADGDSDGFFNSNLQYLNTNDYPDFSPPDDTGVLGATFSPEDKVLVVPLGDSIEFWSSASGTLLARLMTPEELHVLAYPEGAVAPMLALDPAGQTIYAISASGLTVIPLPAPLDQLPPNQWPPALLSAKKQPWLHGPISYRMAAMRAKMPK